VGQIISLLAIGCCLVQAACAASDSAPDGVSDTSHAADPLQATSDCNRNRQPDDLDIAHGTSRDTNVNGVPDECESFPIRSPQGPEDCNHNGVQDDLDIMRGTSRDENASGVPDECERAPSS
jgi:hypothetical protein